MEPLIKFGLIFSGDKMFRFKAQIAEDGSREAIACYLEEPREMKKIFIFIHSLT